MLILLVLSHKTLSALAALEDGSVRWMLSSHVTTESGRLNINQSINQSDSPNQTLSHTCYTRVVYSDDILDRARLEELSEICIIYSN